MDTPTKWILYHGIHAYSITSRDTHRQECKSLKECKRELAAHEKFYHSIGYVVWFGTAISPSGEHIRIHPGNSSYNCGPEDRPNLHPYWGNYTR